MSDERRRLRFTIIATILGSVVVFLDATVVNVALPAISDDLNVGLADQQWIVEAYLLAMVALLLVGGSLGDQFGRRRIFIIGLGLFGITSILCGIAPSSGFLIAARGLQGLAGALLVPGSLAILAATFEGAERGRAVGTWTAWTGIATVIGPAGGGALVEAFSWRAIFLVNVPLILLTMWIAQRCVRESVDPEADRHIDWFGIAFSAVGLGLPVYALIEQPTQGLGRPDGLRAADRGDRDLRPLPVLGVAFSARDARPEPLQGPELRDHQPRDAGRLRRADRRVLLHHPLPAADSRATRRSRPAWRPRRSP